MTDRTTAEPRNVVLLSIDALRADHLSYHGYDRTTSPFLDSLTDRTANFRTAISASSHTREAMPALLTGQYPDIFGQNGYRLVAESVATMLSAREYRTAGFHSNPYLSRAYGYDDGFDAFFDDLVLGRNRLVALAQRALSKFVFKRGRYHVRAAELNRRSLEWLDSLDRPATPSASDPTDPEPIFLWNHYMDVHGPYNPPGDYSYADQEPSDGDAQALYQKCIKRPEAITESERRLLVDLYDGEIRYLDAQIEAFFEELTERGLLKESLVILTADHGDGFGEHGYYTHPRQLHEELLAVPLLISLPGTAGAARIDTPVSTLDIVPTILDFVGGDASALPGTSLLNLLAESEPGSGSASESHPGVVYSSARLEDENGNDRDVVRFAARDERSKHVLDRHIDTGKVTNEQSFDLTVDRLEREPIEVGLESTPTEGRFEELRSRLREHSATRLREGDPSIGPDVETETTEEIEDRLEALGYK
ncbi:arylsulfatase [Halobacteriales archaeon QS_3_64_16]|nr:MAG: arylsulfatase [Halobacteriales archaeon QS_3_64_16]